MLPAEELIEWAFKQKGRTIVTTSFGNHSAVLLHLVTQVNPKAQIVWVDTGFNTEATKRYISSIASRLNLNVLRYSNIQWKDEVPFVDTPAHNDFVEHVKLQPFRMAVQELRPEFWITGLRREQTEHRRTLKQIDQVDGITKICPLLNWTELDMEEYILAHKLPNEPRYFDPTKMYEGRECGLHTTQNYLTK